MLPELPRNLQSKRRINILLEFYNYTPKHIAKYIKSPLVEYESLRQKDKKKRVLLISGKKDNKFRKWIKKFTGNDWYIISDNGHYVGGYSDLTFPAGYFDFIIIENIKLVHKLKNIRKLLSDNGTLYYKSQTPIDFYTFIEKFKYKWKLNKKVTDDEILKLVKCVNLVIGLSLNMFIKKFNTVGFERIRTDYFL
jgi:hydroxymethylpyrimidine pyrophosphatase-like HAD family hydrolase